MKPMSEQIIKQVKAVFEQCESESDPDLQQRTGWGVYIGQSIPKRFFIPKQPVYKIGQTTNIEKRKPQLKTVHKIESKDLHFVEVLCTSMIEGALHNIFRGVQATDYRRFEREWFYLSQDDIDWWGEFRAINSRLFVRNLEKLLEEFVSYGYTRTNINTWFRI